MVGIQLLQQCNNLLYNHKLGSLLWLMNYIQDSFQQSLYMFHTIQHNHYKICQWLHIDQRDMGNLVEIILLKQNIHYS